MSFTVCQFMNSSRFICTMNRWPWLILVICVVNLKPSANEPAPTPAGSRPPRILPPDLRQTIAQNPGITVPESPRTPPTYTAETCTFQCHADYGFATCPAPVEGSQSQTAPAIAVTYGQLAYGGNSCGCLPTKEMLARWAAFGRSLAPFSEFITHSAAASTAYLVSYQFHVEFPFSTVGQTYKTPRKSLFGGKMPGSSSTSAASPPMNPVFRPAGTVAQQPGIKITGTPPRPAPYTDETCNMECQISHGRFAYPKPLEGIKYQTLAVAYGQTTHGGQICNCYPTSEVRAKLAAVVRRPLTLADFIRHSPEASKAFLDIHGCLVEFPTSLTGALTSPTAQQPASSGKRKGIQNLFGFKKSGGGGTSGGK